mgnify:CR=1 FL=1
MCTQRGRTDGDTAPLRSVHSTHLQLLAREDQALLARRDALHLLDLALHNLDCIAGLHIQRDRLARLRLDEDLRASVVAQRGPCGTTARGSHR